MKLYEILAVEKSTQTQLTSLFNDVVNKFNKEHFFKGWNKKLKLLKDDSENDAIEKAGSEEKEVVTSVYKTLEYYFDYWIKHEDVQCTKNSANQIAKTNIIVGDRLIEDIPVDELMGLEARLTKIRELFHSIPTLDATKKWEPSDKGQYIWQTVNPEVTTKTEKVVTPVVLYEATKEHPAQIKEISKDETIGSYTTWLFSGAVTSLQKATMIDRVDDLIQSIKKARVKANDIEIEQRNVGKIIVDFLLEPIRLNK
jgi:hypothetical protein